MYDLNNLEPGVWMGYNVQLQAKKNALRKELAERGIMQKQGKNTFDHYSYFSEAQYKLLFTELFSKHGIELKFTELEYEAFDGSEKQANGRMPRLEFDLIDAETGFYEATTITGEGIDKGDKAGYKAYTGALKYFLANTFMVATGDDPESESPQQTMNTQARVARKTTAAAQATTQARTAAQTDNNAARQAKIPAEPVQGAQDAEVAAEEAKKAIIDQLDQKPFLTEDGEPKASPKQVEILREKYTGDNYKKLCYANGVSRVEDITAKKAAELIEKLMKRGAANNGNE